MSERPSLDELPLGLYELDGAGMVLYFKPERGSEPPHALVGRNFYDDIAPVKQSREFQLLIKNFERSQRPSQSFTYTLELERRSLPVRVLLARVHEHTAQGATESVFVHLKAA